MTYPKNLLPTQKKLNYKHTARCFWLTGLSGSGKSSISNYVSTTLLREGIQVFTLDGDQLRRGLNKDLGFSREDRKENVRRTAEVARLMVDYDFIVIVSAISPYAQDRHTARQLFASDEFVEVHIATDLATCIQRDPKGLYAKAKLGEILHFTGFDDPYEVPANPDIRIQTKDVSIEQAAQPLLNAALLNDYAAITT